MKRRLVLALTAAAFLAGSAGAASAVGQDSAPTLSKRQHQICVLLYHDDGRPPTPICINW